MCDFVCIREMGVVREIPVFHPSYEEFRDFKSYVKKIENSEAAKIGLAKVCSRALCSVDRQWD